MHEMVPILTLFERKGLTQVDTSVNPAYRRPAPGTSPEVVEATLRVFKMGVTAARVLWPRPAPEAQLFVTISSGFTADIGRVNELIIERASRSSRSSSGPRRPSGICSSGWTALSPRPNWPWPRAHRRRWHPTYRLASTSSGWRPLP
jgi:hypothetical protein